MSGMIYDGFDFGYHIIIDKIHRPMLPSVDVQAEDLSGDGARITGVRLEASEIEVDIRLYRPFDEIGARGFEESRRLLASRLLRRKPCKLTLPDAPDIYHMAILSGDTDLERIAWCGTGTLTFYCPDPVGYSANVRHVYSATGDVVCNVGGNYPCLPTFKVTSNSSTVTLTVDGKPLRCLGDATGNDPVVIDTSLHCVTKGDDVCMLDCTDDYPEWAPGLHTVECDYPLIIEWQERWL